MVGLVAAGLAGAMALVVLASSRKGRALSRALVVLNLVFGLAASGALAWVANLGGQIGHPEIRSSQIPPLAGSGEREESP